MADIIDLNDREFEKAAAEGDEGVLAILRAILVEQDEQRKKFDLLIEVLKNTNQALTLLSAAASSRQGDCGCIRQRKISDDL
jgi:hypothetical protein